MSEFHGDNPTPDALPGPDNQPSLLPQDIAVVRGVTANAEGNPQAETPIISQRRRFPRINTVDTVTNRGSTSGPAENGNAGTDSTTPTGDIAESPHAAGGSGSDKPPDPPDIPAASPEGEPADFGVQRFDTEQPSAAEFPGIVTTHNRLVQETLVRFEHYSDVISVGDFLATNTPLECRTPSGTVYLTPRSTGVITAIFLRPSGTHTYHEYYVDQDGSLRRDDIDLDLQLSGFPLPGELPTRDLWERHRRQAASEHENRLLARGWGLNGHLVGPQQQAYLSELLTHARPKSVSFGELNDIAINRLRSDRPPNVVDAQWAAEEFSDSVRHFLENRNPEPDGAGGIIVRSNSFDRRSGFLQLWAGERRTEAGAPAPFVHIHALKDMDSEEMQYRFGDRVSGAGDGKMLVRIGYTVGENGLSCTRLGRLMDTNNMPLITSAPESARADVLEARKVRNFLAGTHDW